MKNGEGLAAIYHCDHPGCAEESSELNINDRMCEITFGIHPDITRGRDSVAVIIFEQFHFCGQHHQFYVDLLLAGIAKEFLPSNPLELLSNDILSYSAWFQKGLGCWITIHDRISDFGTKNFQMAYAPFRNIYHWFTQIVICHWDSNRSIPASMQELKSWQFNTDSFAPEASRKIIEEFVKHVAYQKKLSIK